METFDPSPGSVNVFRHSYQPSEYLSEAFGTIMRTGSVGPRFVLYGTNEVTIPSTEIAQHYYDQKLFEQRKTFNEYNDFIKLDAAFRYAAVARRALFLVRPRDQKFFDRLEAKLEDLDDTPVHLRQQMPHFLYADIAPHDLAEPEVVQAGMSLIRSALASGTENRYMTVKADTVVNHPRGVILPKRAPASSAEPTVAATSE